MKSVARWQEAYARQAKADFRTFLELQKLEGTDIPRCHELLFLQMACEKLCKAHLVRAGATIEDLRRSHGYIAKPLPQIVRDLLDEQAVSKRPRRHDYPMPQFRHLAREIELLAPAINDGQRHPDNCEYLWETSPEKVVVPANFSFPNLSLLDATAGRILLKYIGVAIDALL